MRLFFGLAVFFVACVRSPWSQPTPVGDDPSITFPQFFERAPIKVGGEGEPYEVDGPMLRALAVAANDFLPLREDLPCIDRQEAHLYRVIRRGDIFFIRVDENPAYCGRKHARMDSGAKYAVSLDGKILKQVVDGTEPYIPSGQTTIIEAPLEPGVSPSFDPARMSPPAFLPKSRDGGVTLEKEIPSPPPHSGTPASDGGAGAI